MANNLTYIKAANMFDSGAGIFKRDPMITIENDRIINVRFGDSSLPDTGKIIALKGCTLLPGFIDAHDHLALSPQLKNYPQIMADPDPVLIVRAIVNMKTDLYAGITTARCLGDRNFIDLYLKDAVNQGLIEGPRIFTATRGIKASHAHGFVATPFDGMEAIRSAVRENLKRGADFIKIFVTGNSRQSEYLPYYLSPQEIHTAVAEAHRVGKKVAAHCIGGDGLTACIEQGVDVIEHAYYANDAQIESLVKKDRWVVLTPRINFNDARWANVSEKAVHEMRKNRTEVLNSQQKLMQSGVKLAIGTDATHGEVVEDVIFVVNTMGGTIARALQAITKTAAELCEMGQLVGSITEGKKADLVAVSGAVEKDIQVLRNVCFVMKDGIPVKNTLYHAD
jgi:imidazolonepropionase-like amidohydrolase